MQTKQDFSLAKKRGRPITGQAQTVGVRFHEGDLEAIDNWREAQPDAPKRAEAVRRLVRLALSRP